MASADNSSPAELFAAAQSGDPRALGKALTVIERNDESSREFDQLVLNTTNTGYVIGITGPPGAGKSTLVDLLIGCARKEGKVAVVAVDPSSPFSGGAILGDRVRMSTHSHDEGVFVRSLASRGALGGLSVATHQAIRLFLACGYEYVLVETVGVGQIELDVARATDSVVVVLTPNSGDDVQAAKAGILEVADIFVVNKSDLPGADAVVRNLTYELELSHTENMPPILTTSALNNEGVEDVWKAISSRRSATTPEDLQNNRGEQRKDEIVLRAAAKLQTILRDELDAAGPLAQTDPASAAEALIAKLTKESK